MAGIIPRGNQQVRLQASAPVQIGSTSDAGIEGRAIANLGNSMQKLGNALYQEDKKQREFERRIDEDKNKNEIEGIIKRAANEALKYGAADGSDTESLYKETSGPEINKIIDSIRDEKTRTNVRNYYQAADQSVSVDLGIKSLEKKSQYNYAQLEELQNSDANVIRESPSEAVVSAKFLESGNRLNDLVASKAITTENAEKIRKAGLNTYANQWMQGLETSKQYGKALNLLRANADDPSLVTEMTPSQAKEMGLIDPNEQKLLESKGEKYKMPIATAKNKAKLTPEVKAVMDSMTPKEKARWIDQFDAKIREETALKTADLNAEISGYVNLGLSGQRVDSRQVDALKQSVNNSNLSLQAKKRNIDKINTVEAINAQLQVASNTPRSQWGNLIGRAERGIDIAAKEAAALDPRMGDLGDDFASQSMRMEAMGRLASSLKSIESEQNKDAAAFILKNPQLEIMHKATKDGDPEATRKFVNSSLNRQKYLGIPPEKQRILTRGEASQHAQMLSAAQNGEQSEMVMARLQSQYGDAYPKVFAEIVKEDNELAYLQAAAFVESPTAKRSMINNSKNKKAINEAFKNPELKAVADQIQKSVYNNMNDFSRAIVTSTDDGSRIGLGQTLTEQVALDVKRRYIEDPGASAKSMDTLVQESYNRILGSTFDVASASNSKVVMPRNINGRPIDRRTVEAYMLVNTEASNLKDASLFVPESYKEFGSEAKARYARDVSQKGAWVSNEAQDGMYLVMRDGNGITPVRDQYGNMMEAKFSDIMNNPGSKVTEKLKRRTFIQFLNDLGDGVQKRAEEDREKERQNFRNLIGSN